MASIASAIADALRRRGVSDPAASLTAETGIAVFRVTFDRWVETELERPFEGLRRALRRRSTLDDGDPVERLRRAGWTLAGWRDFQTRWRREPFAREVEIDAISECGDVTCHAPKPSWIVAG